MVRILLIGATGFIGSEIAHGLLRAGHDIAGLARDPEEGARLVPGIRWIKGDLRHLTRAADWTALVAGHDAIINASGALQTGLRDSVSAVQDHAVTALIAAAKAEGVRRFIQISAVGVSEGAPTDFMASKARADMVLAASGLDHVILRPGLVIGRNGFGGTELVRMLAGLPLMAPRLSGLKPIQCVAMADVVAAACAALDAPGPMALACDLVEPDGHDLAEIIALHRRWLGFAPARWSPAVSLRMIRPLSAAADVLGWLGWRSPLRSTAVKSLMDGVSGQADESRTLLGRCCAPLPEMLAEMGAAGKADRWHARLALLYPLALLALMALWLVSGLVGLARTHDAMALLTQGGMAEGAARFCVIGGSFADLAIAAGLVFRPWLKPALGSAVGVTLAYIAGSVWVRPDLWADPLAPMFKAVPALVLALMLLAMADER